MQRVVGGSSSMRRIAMSEPPQPFRGKHQQMIDKEDERGSGQRIHEQRTFRPITENFVILWSDLIENLVGFREFHRRHFSMGDSSAAVMRRLVSGPEWASGVILKKQGNQRDSHRSAKKTRQAIQ